jgi:hypothetical protein
LRKMKKDKPCISCNDYWSAGRKCSCIEVCPKLETWREMQEQEVNNGKEEIQGVSKVENSR